MTLEHPPMRPDQRHLPIPGSYNIRDLGGYRTKGGDVIRWRRFLRADSLHRLDNSGLDHLLGEGLTTVIDLRTRAEVNDAPNPFRDTSAVTFHNLPLFDDLAPAALGRAEVQSTDPLLEFYLTALHSRQGAIRDILGVMSQTNDGAVMFNCTAGKDRTGIVAALLLGIAGVSRADIVADYVLTADLIPELVAEFLDLSRQRGGDVESYARMLRSPASTMSAALDSIESEFGDIRGYLAASGVNADQISALETRLIR
ncbi:MAG: protein tyrosine phosphatase [Rhodobacteraceae bacterium]|nr:MAG: protein tyrosine phosphatase [Paracoccaceae bacterium]